MYLYYRNGIVKQSDCYKTLKLILKYKLKNNFCNIINIYCRYFKRSQKKKKKTKFGATLACKFLCRLVAPSPVLGPKNILDVIGPRSRSHGQTRYHHAFTRII